MPNYRELVGLITPTLFKGYYGERFAGLLCGALADLAADAATEALKAPWIKQSSNPDDSLPLLGSDWLLEAYPAETPANHRARLQIRWESWEFAGDESSIENQLAAAGYPGAYVTFFPARPGPAGETDYWSQFWIRFPFGTHPVVAESAAVGSFNVGDGTAVGPIGFGTLFAETLRGIVRKWKPGHWICRGFIFDLESAVVGGFVVGDGTVVGGYIEVS